MAALNAPLRPFRADAVAAARAEFNASFGRQTKVSQRGMRNVADMLEHGAETGQAATPALNIAA